MRRRALSSGMREESSPEAPGPVPRCPLCGGTENRISFRQGDGGQFEFRRCLSCRLVWYDPARGLDQGKYSRSLPDPLSGEGAANVSQTASWSFIRQTLPGRGSLLDIGCGNGRLIHLAAGDGWRAEGVEIDPGAAEQVSRRTGLPVHAGLFPGAMPSLPGKYDLVVLRHVLEHIPDPVAAMDALRSLLAEGGRALLEFPNIDSLDARWRRLSGRLGIHRKRYSPGYVPGHCCEYCRESFEFLLRRSGMVLERWETYSSRPFMSSLLRIVPVGGKARALVRLESPRPLGGG